MGERVLKTKSERQEIRKSTWPNQCQNPRCAGSGLVCVYNGDGSGSFWPCPVCQPPQEEEKGRE
jgi:hypothetical protein